MTKKPEVRRKTIDLSTEKMDELRATRARIVGPERKTLSAKALAAKREYDAARVELARAAELLRAEREIQGMSLHDVQERTGISRAAICRLENLVDANPTVGTLDRIAEALGKRLVIGLEDR